jgi:transcriptional regulator with XRE-family HTH domain
MLQQQNDEMLKLSARVKFAREKAGLSHAELAALWQITESYERMVEAGTRNVSKKLKIKLEKLEQNPQHSATSYNTRPPEPSVMTDAPPETYDEQLKKRLAAAACGIVGGFPREESILALEDILRDAKTLLDRMKSSDVVARHGVHRDDHGPRKVGFQQTTFSGPFLKHAGQAKLKTLHP